LRVSGDDSGDAVGDGVFRLKELALSAIEGDLEPRTLPFLTEKKAGDDPGGGAVVPGVAIAPGARLESFSKAFILCEIPDPRLTFFAIGLAGCWLMRFRYAAEADIDRVGSIFVGGLRCGDSTLSFRIGLEKALEKRLRSFPVFLGLGNTGLIGDFETEIGWAS
jgi:hypothetical protein